MVQVNPSPQPKLPKSLQEDPFTLAYFTQLEIVIRQLRERVGGDTDIIAQAEANFNINLTAQVQELRARIDGLPEFTIDTTGFTVDTTMITTDKVIA